MKRIAVSVIMCLVLSFHMTASGQSPAPNWVKVTDKTKWSPRDSSGEMTFKNQVWLLGGWEDSFKDPPRDVWSSADGKEWKQQTATAPWKHSDLPTTLVFQDQMWIMAGWHGGRLAHASASSAVWSSTDGIEWKQVTPAAGWSPRLGAAGVVFKGKMWILGGNDKYYFGTDQDLRNDVWSSADGVKWEQATEHAPWAARAYHGAVALNDRMYVFGGGNYVPGYVAYNDVWSSPDGINWTEETKQAPWSPRMWFSADVYRDRMWVLGGWSNKPSKNWNDVWYSANGKAWTELKTETIWAPRHEQSAYVFQDKLWITAGNTPPLVNDVWQLHLPPDWMKPGQPVKSP